MAKPPKLSQYGTREEWLVALVNELRPDFQAQELEIPPVRVSCSWPSRSIRKTLGQCFGTKSAKDGIHQIVVSPAIGDVVQIVETMVHELLHACLPDGTGHKAPFKRGMVKLGLEGKATATHAGQTLLHHLHELCAKLGEYPHSALKLKDPAEKKQGTRLIKLTCPGCGYVLRTTQKWIETGLPTCACGEEFKQEEK